MNNYNTEFTDIEDYIHDGVFEYINGSTDLPNWSEGQIDGKKCKLWWFDGLRFDVNTTKNLVCFCKFELEKKRHEFKIGDKIVGYFSPSAVRVFKYKFPKF